VTSGVAGALASSELIRHAKPMWVGVVSHGAVTIALIVCFAVGLVFGYFPARRAGRLDAIKAIHGT
jgi:putative ABC transport system permease protein